MMILSESREEGDIHLFAVLFIHGNRNIRLTVSRKRISDDNLDLSEERLKDGGHCS